jgi:hypothetical protein
MAGVTLASGPPIKAYGPDAYLAMVPVALAGVLLLVIALRSSRRPGLTEPGLTKPDCA